MAKLPDAAELFVPYLPGQPAESRSIIQFAGHLPSHPPSSRGPVRKRRRIRARASGRGEDEDEEGGEAQRAAAEDDEETGQDGDEQGPNDESPKGPDAHLFFWLVKARHVADRQPLVIWCAPPLVVFPSR